MDRHIMLTRNRLGNLFTQATIISLSCYLCLFLGCSDNDADKRISNLELQLQKTNLLLDNKLDSDWPSIDTTSKSYAIVDTAIGSLLFSCTKVEPYLDGYKIYLEIGNPTTAKLSGINLTVLYGVDAINASDVFNHTIPALEDRLDKKTYELAETIHPGTWSPIEIVIPAAKAEDVSKLRIQAHIDRVILSRPN